MNAAAHPFRPPWRYEQAEAAVSLVDPGHLDALAEGSAARLHFGSEFCESLLPSPGDLDRAVATTRRLGMALTLVTPIASDHGVARIRHLLSRLEPEGEVVANDWGVLRLLGGEYPHLRPVAGRMLCKMIKDPRLPSAQWTRLYPHGIHSDSFSAILSRLGVARIELDVPPFAEAAHFRSDRMAVSVHAPFGFAVKGRSCKIGSLHLPASAKFATGHGCRRECLTYRTELSREGGADLPTFQRGNTVFFHHSPAMAAALGQAVAEGAVDRVVVAGDWR